VNPLPEKSATVLVSPVYHLRRAIDLPVATLLLESVIFIVRDLVRPTTRPQAILALVLSVPSALMVFSRRLG
jgi:hypothetical protein